MIPWTALACLVLCATDDIPVDLSGYVPDGPVRVRHDGGRLVARWPIEGGEAGELVLDLRGGALIEAMGIARDEKAEAAPILRRVEPVASITVGTRAAPPGRPPGMSVFNTFFDSPAKRPHETFPAVLTRRRARVASAGRRATIAVGDLAAGPFAGELRFTLYAGARLVHVEAVVSTRRERTAFLYDAGLAGNGEAGWEEYAFVDTEGRLRRAGVDSGGRVATPAVRHRAIIISGDDGSIACFPPPHQYFFPRDLTDNLHTVWAGVAGGDAFGFGIRQPGEGGGNFVPWFNAPPGTEQRLGVFYLLSRGKAEDALNEALRYTHGDRFPDLAGHATFTSHWHMAIAMAAMGRAPDDRTIPDFVPMFKEMGVEIVHLAEFHGDGHQDDPGPLRLPELRAMFDECRRLSDADLLLVPGEEVAQFLGLPAPGRHPGHWMSLFPRPVYWTMKRAPGQPFAEDVPPFGTVYHVGGREDMVELLRREHGLAWSSHPRVKASSWAPDVFRSEEFYRADSWLGAAWKALPADLSEPRLGRRALDLLDDMANWGERKQLVGEVDVFKIDHTHELYGHMNINYLRLDRVPRFDDGWQPVLDALRAGRFFTTTGEVLLREFTVGGKRSGETLATGPGGGRPEVIVDLEWTFPLRFVEVISGDGAKVHRDRVDLPDTGPFGRRTLTLHPDLAGRNWVRVEAWDIAANGAFTQPVWLERGR